MNKQQLIVIFSAILGITTAGSAAVANTAEAGTTTGWVQFCTPRGFSDCKDRDEQKCN